MSYLVDTNVLSELAKPQPAGEVLAVNSPLQPIALTVVTRNVADFKNAGVKLLNPFS